MYVAAWDQTHDLLFPGADILPTELPKPDVVHCLKLPLVTLIVYANSEGSARLH